jgi:hypothetical protein
MATDAGVETENSSSSLTLLMGDHHISIQKTQELTSYNSSGIPNLTLRSSELPPFSEPLYRLLTPTE